MADQSPTGLCLAAGASTRMGHPKALTVIDGTAAVRRVTEALLAGGCARVIVVLGAEADRIRPAVPDTATVVVNEEWARGRTGSLQAGLRASRDAPGWVLLPVDHPLATAGDVRALIEAWAPGEVPLVRPIHEGRGGHPILIDGALCDQVLALGEDEPLRDLLWRHRPRERTVPGSPGTRQNLDTPDDLPG